MPFPQHLLAAAKSQLDFAAPEDQVSVIALAEVREPVTQVTISADLRSCPVSEFENGPIRDRPDRLDSFSPISSQRKSSENPPKIT